MGSGPGSVVVQDHASAFMKSASAFQRMGDYESAAENYGKVLMDHPERVDALYGRGVCYIELSKLDMATADFTKIITLDPKYSAAYFGRGTALRDKGAIEQTILDYGRAIDLEPHNAEYLSSRGYAYFYEGNYKQAATDFSRSFGLDSDAYCAMFRYLARVRASDDRALTELEDAITHIKEGVWPHAASVLLAGKTTPEKAIGEASEPDQTAEAHFYVGQWRLIRGEKHEALSEFKIVIETCPKLFIEYAIALKELQSS